MTTAVTTIGVTDSIRTAQTVLERAPLKPVMVVQGRRLVGILSDRDLRWSFVRLAHASEFQVGLAMTPTPITVSPDTPVTAAAAIMIEHRVRMLPVVDDDRTLAGILTASDLADTALRSGQYELVRDLLAALTRVRTIARDDAAQSLSEYALLAGLIVVVGIAAVTLFGDTIPGLFAALGTALSGAGS